MGGNLIGSIVKQLRKIVYSFNEKPTVQLDDYELEHFLLYHKLVGTSPDNQRSFKDVRSDIFHAIRVESPLQLAAVLRLAPLWWEDKLKSIFSEADRKQSIAVLLPDVSADSWPNNSDPLGHEDWRTRANAASMLAFLEVKQADERIARALDDTADSGKGAFCHIAYALGKLKTEKALQSLRSHLYSPEPWFRVDAAGALALWPLDDVKAALMEAMLSSHALSDYMAVAIARSHSPATMLDDDREVIQDGLCEMIIGLVAAASGTFNNDVALDADIHLCLPTMQTLFQKKKSPLHAQAYFKLADWMLRNYDEIVEKAGESAIPTRSEIAGKVDGINSKELQSLILTNLKNPSQDKRGESDLRHAISLAADLELKEAGQILIKMLAADSKHMDLVIESLGRLGNSPEASQSLTQLARRLVDLNQRCQQALSKQPVQEFDAAKAKTYWMILKALGNLPSQEAQQLLVEASSDFAPDKREQAMSSLTSSVILHPSGERKTETIQIVEKALGDPSTPVRAQALHCAAQLDAVALLESVIKLAESKEVSVSRQAMATLDQFWDNGHEKEVAAALNTKISSETDHFRREKLAQFLASKQQ